MSKVYRSFEDFEREELRRIDSIYATLDRVAESSFLDEELDFGSGDGAPGRGRGAGRRRAATVDDEE